MSYPTSSLALEADFSELKLLKIKLCFKGFNDTQFLPVRPLLWPMHIPFIIRYFTKQFQSADAGMDLIIMNRENLHCLSPYSHIFIKKMHISKRKLVCSCLLFIQNLSDILTRKSSSNMNWGVYA